MRHEDYMDLFYPVVSRACAFMVECEKKHGSGIAFKDDDLLAAAGHCISEHRGKPNEDGESHAVAALVRVMKVVLKDS